MAIDLGEHMTESEKHILWDWNGTLLDDVVVCIDCMNIMLEKRNLPQIDRQTYRDIFTFPVIDYYKKLGFDFNREPFTDLAPEYISLYTEHSPKAKLHRDVVSVLKDAKAKGFSQFILSAMEQEELLLQATDKGILHYFEDIIGLDNIHAKSKIGQGKKLIEDRSLPADQCVVIGDTYHDYEVAKELGCRCILVDKGHQNMKKYTFDDRVSVIGNIVEIKELLFY